VSRPTVDPPPTSQPSVIGRAQGEAARPRVLPCPERIIWSAPKPAANDPVARASWAGPGLPVMTRLTVPPGFEMSRGSDAEAFVVRSASVATPRLTVGSGATPAVTVETSASVAVVTGQTSSVEATGSWTGAASTPLGLGTRS
jgi:hypothetical protein